MEVLSRPKQSSFFQALVRLKFLNQQVHWFLIFLSDLTDQIIHFLLYIKLIYTCNFEVILVYSLN